MTPLVSPSHYAMVAEQAAAARRRLGDLPFSLYRDVMDFSVSGVTATRKNVERWLAKRGVIGAVDSLVGSILRHQKDAKAALADGSQYYPSRAQSLNHHQRPMKIERITITAGDEGGTTIEKSYLAESKRQAAKIRAAIKTLGFFSHSGRILAHDERLYSGRVSRDGDYCFELLTLDEVRKTIDSDSIEELQKNGRLEYDACKASACINFVGTAKEVADKTK